MKIMKSLVLMLSFFLLLTGCNGNVSDDKNGADFSLLDENDFAYNINRISEIPDVQYPSDDLQESDYKYISNGTQYSVSFSADGEIVSIEPGSILGHKIAVDDKSKVYELDEGTFSGGQFVVWTNDEGFEAELTIYGSGVPIIKSERGKLVQR